MPATAGRTRNHIAAAMMPAKISMANRVLAVMVQASIWLKPGKGQEPAKGGGRPEPAPHPSPEEKGILRECDLDQRAVLHHRVDIVAFPVAGHPPPNPSALVLVGNLASGCPPGRAPGRPFIGPE